MIVVLISVPVLDTYYPVDDSVREGAFYIIFIVFMGLQVSDFSLE